MCARNLLAEMQAAGVHVAAQGDRLAVRPASKLRPEWRAALIESKAEVLALLARMGNDRTANRLARLRAWGWSEDQAQAMAHRLAARDREDQRVSCVDCRHHRPGHCGNHRQAGLSVPTIGRDWATLMQRCDGFTE